MIYSANKVMDFIIDSDNLAKLAQVGVDLTLEKVFEVTTMFELFNDDNPEKKIMSEYTQLFPTVNKFWRAEKGFNVKKGRTYSIQFDQGLKNLLPHLTAFIYQRSTLARNGLLIRSSVYDPGFGTPKMGAMLYAFNSGFIEVHSRVAQILIHENYRTDSYNGQYQNKNTAGEV